jgi:glycosyltransferase involved in cell wall biosynthesis
LKMPDLLPRVSIVTVVYNGEATLERTILSVKSLNYSNLEYIIIDGASKDGTLDIVERHKEVVSRLISEPDKGLYDAMNKGLDLASGDYVWFINSGDEVADPELLNRIFGINSSADIYYGATEGQVSNLIWLLLPLGLTDT